jgi:GntR family transcriptional regulator
MSVEARKRKSTRYRDIASRLQKDIRLGRYDVGNLLPTETELMARYDASRQTVREALRILTEQGLIVRRAGLGSVVITAEPPVLFSHSVTSLSE